MICLDRGKLLNITDTLHTNTDICDTIKCRHILQIIKHKDISLISTDKNTGAPKQRDNSKTLTCICISQVEEKENSNNVHTRSRQTNEKQLRLMHNTEEFEKNRQCTKSKTFVILTPTQNRK